MKLGYAIAQPVPRVEGSESGRIRPEFWPAKFSINITIPICSWHMHRDCQLKYISAAVLHITDCNDFLIIMNIFKSGLTDQEVDFFGSALIFKQPSFTN